MTTPSRFRSQYFYFEEDKSAKTRLRSKYFQEMSQDSRSNQDRKSFDQKYNVQRKIARCFRVRPMIRKTQRHTDILARPIPMILNICEMTLHFSTKGICSRGRQYICLPRPMRTNLVRQPTPIMPAIYTTVSEAPKVWSVEF